MHFPSSYFTKILFSARSVPRTLLEKLTIPPDPADSWGGGKSPSSVSLWACRCRATQQLSDGQWLMPPLQSAYSRHHSTGTALLRVMADVFAAADQQRVMLLALLDLSAAFDCVDHDILLMRLQCSVWLSGCVIDWIRSSCQPHSACAVRWWLFAACLLAVGCTTRLHTRTTAFSVVCWHFDVVTAHGAAAHFYLDDGQLYVNSLAADADVSAACVADVNVWMKTNRLRFSVQKMHLIWLGSCLQDHCDRPTAAVSKPTSDVDRARSWHPDWQLTDDGRPGRCHLSVSVLSAAPATLSCSRWRRKQPWCSSTLDSTHLHYCNSVLYGIADNQLRRLQSAQNAVAWLATGMRRTEHITPVLKSLHGLPVRQQIVYKLATLVH